ncbi:MAG: IS4 family transposase, partial [Chloroflexota bacterium]|nr:IS4 family transposase [Chloroflexota bacterium]
GSSRSPSAFPQVQCVYLAECGTHGIVDAGFWPCKTSERVGARRLLRSDTSGMLLLWDRGFHEFDRFVGVQARQAQGLGRLPAHVHPDVVAMLPDGTALAYLYPSAYQRSKQGERVLVRVISYTITDPPRPGYGETHRLVPTLLDPQLYPALDLVCAYHERWELELTIDEMQTHQRLAQRTPRSRTPVGGDPRTVWAAAGALRDPLSDA